MPVHDPSQVEPPTHRKSPVAGSKLMKTQFAHWIHEPPTSVVITPAVGAAVAATAGIGHVKAAETSRAAATVARTFMSPPVGISAAGPAVWVGGVGAGRYAGRGPFVEGFDDR